MTPEVFDRYVGIPWRKHGRDASGTDCWGLVRLFHERELGLVLPSYADRYADSEDRAEVGAVIAGERGPWVEVPRGSERPGDVILLKVLGVPCHVGVVVERGVMLHQFRGVNSALGWYEGLRGGTWVRRVDGIFRHRDRA